MLLERLRERRRSAEAEEALEKRVRELA